MLAKGSGHQQSFLHLGEAAAKLYVWMHVPLRGARGREITALYRHVCVYPDLFVVCRVRNLSTVRWQHVSSLCSSSTTSLGSALNADAPELRWSKGGKICSFLPRTSWNPPSIRRIGELLRIASLQTEPSHNLETTVGLVGYWNRKEEDKTFHSCNLCPRQQMLPNLTHWMFRELHF